MTANIAGQNDETTVERVARKLRALVLTSGDTNNCARKVFRLLTADDKNVLSLLWLENEAAGLRRDVVRRWERDALALEEAPPTDNTERVARRASRTAERRAQAVQAGFRTIGEMTAYRRSPEGRDAKMEALAAKTRSITAEIQSAWEFTEAFLNLEFKLGDGREVTWGDATQDEHTQRVVYMTRKIEGLESDVTLHLQVIDILINTGQPTLRAARQASPEPHA